MIKRINILLIVVIMLFFLVFKCGCKDKDYEEMSFNIKGQVGDDKTKSDVLTLEELIPITKEAKRRWLKIVGNKPIYEKTLSNLKYKIVRFKNDVIGRYCCNSTKILFDDNGNGFGWYIDKTPETDEEYFHYNQSNILLAFSGGAMSKVDLLSIVMHEMGHALGLDDNNDKESLMCKFSILSTRVNPSIKEWEKHIGE